MWGAGETPWGALKCMWVMLMQSAGSTVTCSQVAGSISMRPSGAGLQCRDIWLHIGNVGIAFAVISWRDMTVTLSPSVLYTRHTPKMFVLQTLTSNALLLFVCTHYMWDQISLESWSSAMWKSDEDAISGDRRRGGLSIVCLYFCLLCIYNTILWRMQWYDSHLSASCSSGPPRAWRLAPGWPMRGK